MARTRYIKPDAFTDEDIGDLPPIVRWFFAGMWTQADREGRLEDHPRELKLKIIPYDEETGDWCIEKLIRKRKVVRYRVGQKSYLWIVNFKKHQHIHKDERASSLPEVPEIIATPNEHQDGTNAAPNDSGAHAPFNGNGNSNGNSTATLTGAADKQSSTPEPEAFEADSTGEFQPTAWGLWGWHNQERKNRSLFDEPTPPYRLPTWYEHAVAKVGIPGMIRAYLAYLEDIAFAAKGWPFAIFMAEQVYLPRANAPPPKRARL